MTRAFATILLCVVLTTVGAAAGWYAAHRSAPPAADGEAEDAGGEPTTLSDQALKNLGVRIAPATLSDFVRTIEVQAVLVDRPENRRPVTTVFGGLVTEVHVETGQFVKAGAPLVTILRDPIPRPTLDLTAQLLVPVSEHVHEAVAALRAAQKRLDIADREIARLKPFAKSEDGLPLVSRGKLAEMQYERERAQIELDVAFHELERHGLTDEEQQAVAKGAHPPANASLWKRVLQENGLWSRHADRIFAALPAATQALPWTVAAVGELSALGLADAELAAFLEKTPAATARFADVAGLLMQGMPLGTVAVLVAKGGLEPALVVRAPTGGAVDWDVEEVAVRPGQRVGAGQPLATLYDPRRMWLQVEPVGREVGAVAAAVAAGRPGRIRPLVPDPTLAGIDTVAIQLERMRTKADGEGALAYAELANEPLGQVGASGYRTWTLRPGMRFLLEIPAETLPGRFILPPGAITEEGPETIVYVQDGSAYRAVPVHVEYRDDERVVLADDGSLYPDDPVVVEGAYALGLALQKKAGGGGHGHGHSHD